MILTAVVVVTLVGLAFACTIGHKVEASDFDDGNSDGTQDDPVPVVVPVVPPGSDTDPDPPPAPEVLPVASGRFEDISVTVRVWQLSSYYGVTGYDFSGLVSAPDTIITPYSGDVNPVYEWVQYDPASLFSEPSNVTVRFWVYMSVFSLFKSAEYMYPHYLGDGTLTYSSYFGANWTSEKKSSDLYFTMFDSSETLTVSWSTGNIYYWEHGSYRANIHVAAEYFNTYDDELKVGQIAGMVFDFEV